MDKTTLLLLLILTLVLAGCGGGASSLTLSRQDIFSIVQSQGLGNVQSGTTPPNGSVPGGSDPSFQGWNTQSNSSTDSASHLVALDPNHIPTPLIRAVIDYRQTKNSL